MMRSRLSAAIFLVVSLVSLVSLPVSVRAQGAPSPRGDADAERDPNLERKRRAYAFMQEGKVRFDLGKFDEAIDLFQKAFEVYPYPEALYSLAQAHRMKKDYERAVFFYKSYLRNQPNASNRAAVEARIHEMEQLDAEQKASATKPPQGTKQPPSPDEPPGAPARVPASVAAPVPVTASPPRPLLVDAPRWYSDTWGWTILGGGVLTAGVGGLILPGAYSLSDPSAPPDDQLRINEERDDRRNRKIAWSLVGVGSVAIVLGAIKLARTDAPHAVEAAHVHLVVGPHSIGLRATF